ncbi:MAG: sensor domain-containing diguanylate cyclase [Planctomycetota bacterium]
MTDSILQDVESKRWRSIQSHIDRFVQSDETLASVALRGSLGQVYAATDQHVSLWERPDEFDQVKVPIRNHHRVWGHLEMSWVPLTPQGWRGYLGGSTMRLLLFFFAAGMISYTLFTIRLFGAFRSTQIVPEHVKESLDTLSEGLLLLGHAGDIVFANKAFLNAARMTREEVMQKLASDFPWVDESGEPVTELPWTDAITRDRSCIGKRLRLHMPGSGPLVFNVNVTPLSRGGRSLASERGALATFHDVTGEELHRLEQQRMFEMLKHSRDEVQEKNARLEVLANRDSLTDCLNRRAFFEGFEEAWTKLRSDDAPLSCLMLDIDHFKSVNDTYGHHVGDDVLRKVAAAVRQRFEADNLVGRYGGEEFCVVFPGTDLKQAVEAADTLRQDIEAIRFEEPKGLRLTASIGVSDLRFDAEHPQALVNQADSALYVAKHLGRNRVLAFNPSMEAETSSDQSDEEQHEAKLDLPSRSVSSLFTMLAQHDPPSARHSRSVADLAATLCQHSEHQDHAFLVEVGSLLHRVGRVRSFVEPGVATHTPPMPTADNTLSIIDALHCPQLSRMLRAFYRMYEPKLPLKSDDLKSDEWETAHRAAQWLWLADRYLHETNVGSVDPESLIAGKPTSQSQDPDFGLRLNSSPRFLEAACPDHIDETIWSQARQFLDRRQNLQATGVVRMQNLIGIQIGHATELLGVAMAARDSDRLLRAVDELIQMATVTDLASIITAAQHVQEAMQVQEGLHVQKELTSDSINASIPTGTDLDDTWPEVLDQSRHLLIACQNAIRDLTGASLEHMAAKD